MEKEIDIRTIHTGGRVYINKFDVIKFLETIKKDAMTMEALSTIQRLIVTFMKAN